MTRHIHSVVAAVLADVMQPVKCSCGEDLIISCPKGCTDAELNASARRLIKERRQMSPVLVREMKKSGSQRVMPRAVKPAAVVVPVKRVPLASPDERALSRKQTEPRILGAFARAAGAALKPSDIALTSGMPRTRIEMCCTKLVAKGILTREMPEGRKRGYLYSLVEA